LAAAAFGAALAFATGPPFEEQRRIQSDCLGKLGGTIWIVLPPTIIAIHQGSNPPG
jgi:hypothetical protein